MLESIVFVPVFAAAGWSILYMLMGGGFFGAVVLFIILKMLGK